MGNMEIQEFRILLDRILRLDGAAFLHMAGCYSNGMCVAQNEEKSKFFDSYFESYFDGILIERSKEEYFARFSSNRKNIDCTNICELLDKVDRGDISSDVLFHTIEYNNKYNKSPLCLFPFYTV